MPTRRVFLEATAVAVTAGLGGAAPLAGAEEGWFDKPMRWAQLNLTEDDPANMDIGFWLDYFKRIHADALCLTAGGVVAFYPTKVPLHHRSRWLSGRETFFQEVLEGCKKQGMVVVARTDPHATYQDVYERAPDWIAVDAEGRKRRHWESPEMWVTCALGPYNFEFMTDGDAGDRLDCIQVDGIFSNRWEGSGMCYCEHCRANFRTGIRHGRFRARTIRTIRRGATTSQWREKRLFELWRLWDARDPARSIRGARYIANSGGGAMSGLDMKTGGRTGADAVRRPAGAQRHDGAVGQRQERQGVPLHAGAQGHRRHLSHGHRGVRTAGRTRCRAAAETRIWVLDGIANGLRPWFNKVSGSVHDRRWLPVVEDLYTWHYRNERYLRNEEPIARVGMVYSQQTATYYGGPQARQKVEDHTLGMYQALIEARIPFEMVHDGLLDGAHIDRYKAAAAAQHRGAFGRAVRPVARVTSSAAAAWWRPTRRRSTTSGASGGRISGWRTCSAHRSRSGWTDRSRIPISWWRRTRRGQHPPC